MIVKICRTGNPWDLTLLQKTVGARLITRKFITIFTGGPRLLFPEAGTSKSRLHIASSIYVVVLSLYIVCKSL